MAAVRHTEDVADHRHKRGRASRYAYEYGIRREVKKVALVYEDLGAHPRFPTARVVMCYDSDGCGRAFLYRGYRDSRCYMKLYPDDAETYRFSGKRVIRIDRLRKKE